MPTGGRSPGFDDEPLLSSVKVPCDPAQVIVNHASFRVQLAAPVVGRVRAAARAPVLRARGGGRRAPVVWSGRTDPGGSSGATTQLLRAVRTSGIGLDSDEGDDVAATQILPRVAADTGPTVIGQRGPADADTALLRPVRPGPYDPYGADPEAFGSGRDAAYDDAYAYAGDGDADRFEARESYDASGRRRGGDSVRHAYYPGRRMNLGVVLLPLRIFLGLISIYAGMGKLCDPVYFDGGERGSMVKWLSSLEPWTLAVPLRDFALAHPVGSGLTVAFLQVVVGVLTICGLWQRLAASVGALLSAVLLMTVTWHSIPAYDAPDFIYLAAWSPLVIAGAPVYSLDARLAGEAWRRLGPRVDVIDLRRRVLRRGAAMTSVIAGLTLLIGSVLGGAVRSATVTSVPRPGEPAINNLPGRPLPSPHRQATRPQQTRTAAPQRPGTPTPDAAHTAGPTGAPSSPAGSSSPTAGATSGTGRRPGAGATTGAPQQSASTKAPAPTPAQTSGGTGGGTTGSGDDGSGSSDGRSKDHTGTLGGLLG
ncbi:DoxX family membrane protein [Streptomyces sp. NPDC059080]|uniref:DoxX family protein n=1 Tax=Streptomyces sp. NPDC059080 TaxID=3346718 RepID=UPI0036C71C22